MNMFEKSRRLLREVTPTVSKSMILLMAILAFALSSCVSVSITEVEDPAVAATAMHYENVAEIQSLATQIAPFFDWREFEPCAESSVRVETPIAAGSGNLINRRLVVKTESNGQQSSQEVFQIFVSGHQVTEDLNLMLGQPITVTPPSGVGGEPGQYMVLAANKIIDVPNGTGEDIISLIAVGNPGGLAMNEPVGDKIGAGTNLKRYSQLMIASIPSAAGIVSLSPTTATYQLIDHDTIFAIPQIGEGSVAGIQGSSGSGACLGGQMIGSVVRADREGMVITPYDEMTAQFALDFFNMTLLAMSGSNAYINP